MGNLIINDKEIAIPGEEIATGLDFLPSTGTFREGESIIANRLGIISVENKVIKLTALKGVYEPKRGDAVIGIIKDTGFAGWSVDIGAPVLANLPVGEAVRERVELLKTELTRYFQSGDILMTQIINVTKSLIIQLSMRDFGLKKLIGGRLIRVTPQKVPRIIGKGGSMITMIKEYTKCNMHVGQNGLIWIDGPVESQIVAEKAIKYIEEFGHKSGMTEKIKELLEKGDINEQA